MMTTAPVLRFAGVSVRRGGRTILGPIDWLVARGERWVIVGPNGAGKTTLVQVASTYLWPTTGSVEVLGSRIGHVDSRELRLRIGYEGSGLERSIPDELSAHEVVVTARHAALGPWWHAFDEDDHARADQLLERLGIGAVAERSFGLLSAGERRRVQIARALMPGPDLLLLDEPSASLDLGAREMLVRDLDRLATDETLPAIVMVTHHVEEIPTGFGHALVLADGVAVAAGPIATTLDGPVLSRAFGVPIRVGRDDGRVWARLDRGSGG
jgi:iron complex transport system ATP-binding protein